MVLSITLLISLMVGLFFISLAIETAKERHSESLLPALLSYIPKGEERCLSKVVDTILRSKGINYDLHTLGYRVAFALVISATVELAKERGLLVEGRRPGYVLRPRYSQCDWLVD